MDLICPYEYSIPRADHNFKSSVVNTYLNTASSIVKIKISTQWIQVGRGAKFGGRSVENQSISTDSCCYKLGSALG